MRPILHAALVALASVALAGAAHAGVSITFPKGPDPEVRKWPHWPYATVCGGIPFDPVGIFGGETVAQRGSGEPEAALRAFLEANSETAVPKRFWRLAAIDESHAEFAAGRLSTVPFWLVFERRGGEWVSSTFGECRPRSLRDGIVAAEWRLDREAPPRPASRTIAVHVGERSCTGGASPNARVQEPGLSYTRKRLVVTLWVEPLPPGAYTCEAVRDPRPYRVRLPRPLGRRSLWNGATYPPRKELSAPRPKASASAQPSASARLRQ